MPSPSELPVRSAVIAMKPVSAGWLVPEELPGIHADLEEVKWRISLNGSPPIQAERMHIGVAKPEQGRYVEQFRLSLAIPGDWPHVWTLDNEDQFFLLRWHDGASWNVIGPASCTVSPDSRCFDAEWGFAVAGQIAHVSVRVERA